jgi:hypothetical protein
MRNRPVIYQVQRFVGLMERKMASLRLMLLEGSIHQSMCWFGNFATMCTLKFMAHNEDTKNFQKFEAVLNKEGFAVERGTGSYKIVKIA